MGKGESGWWERPAACYLNYVHGANQRFGIQADVTAGRQQEETLWATGRALGNESTCSGRGPDSGCSGKEQEEFAEAGGVGDSGDAASSRARARSRDGAGGDG